MILKVTIMTMGTANLSDSQDYYESVWAYLCPHLYLEAANNGSEASQPSWDTAILPVAGNSFDNMTSSICSSKNLSALYDYYTVCNNNVYLYSATSLK